MTTSFLKLAGITAVIAAVFTNCSSSQKAQQENRVGIVTYGQYSLRNTAPPADTSFLVFNNQADFDAMFVPPANKQSQGPDFSGQTAVAISMPATAAAKIERATISGSTMNIYAVTCDGENADCSKNGLVLVTTPRSTSVKNVRFFFNGSPAKTLRVSN